ncbi:MAG: HDIG domain-containing protein [Dehalococcoidia bacterium]|nr:HDIG domain-containing protein [Dehalococcoidia bacterium]
MIRNRIRQFREAHIAPCAADYALAREWLDGQLLTLFEGQHPRDIVHTAATARWLLARGHESRELIQAALLHDIGKGHQRRRDRVAYVVATNLGIVRWLAKRESRLELRRAVARSLRHSAAGAEMLRAAGAPACVIELTARHHESPGDDPVLALLQQADAAT